MENKPNPLKGVYMLRAVSGAREWWVPFPDPAAADRMARGIEGAEVVYVSWGQDCHIARETGEVGKTIFRFPRPDMYSPSTRQWGSCKDFDFVDSHPDAILMVNPKVESNNGD